MLTDVAQEIQAAHAAKPIVVVRHYRGIFTVKRQKWGQLIADFFYPTGHGFRGIQAALYRFEARVANHACGTAHQCNRLVTCQLETAQSQNRQ